MTTIPYKSELTQEQTNNIIEWIAALRSGEYEQGVGALSKNGQYCCLGVCSKIQGIEERNECFIYPVKDIKIPLSKLPHIDWLLRTFGFESELEVATYNGRASTLYTINDYRVSFEYIATIIEACFINREVIEIPID